MLFSLPRSAPSLPSGPSSLFCCSPLSPLSALPCPSCLSSLSYASCFLRLSSFAPARPSPLLPPCFPAAHFVISVLSACAHALLRKSTALMMGRWNTSLACTRHSHFASAFEPSPPHKHYALRRHDHHLPSTSGAAAQPPAAPSARPSTAGPLAACRSVRQCKRCGPPPRTLSAGWVPPA